MDQRLRSLAGVVAVAAALASAPAVAATVVVGVPNWPSAQVTANIIGQLLEDEFGVTARLRDIGTVELFDAIDRGEVDVHPEVWLPNLDGFVAEYVDKRGTVTLSPVSVPAAQHMCTTRQTQQATGLTAIRDLADPEMARRFDTDEDGLGEVWIGDRTWSSTRVERVRAKSYGYDETMMLLTMPEDVAMAAVDVAVVSGQPIVFYCYSPHVVFALHDVVMLEEPPYDPEAWEILAPEEDPAWLARSRAGTAWAPASFRIAYATDLEQDHAEIVGFLKRIALTAEETTQMSAAIVVDGRTAEEVAAEWIAVNEARVKEWVQ